MPEFKPGQELTFADIMAMRALKSEPVGAGIPSTPEDIDAIEDKDELRELLDAHGVEYSGRAGIKSLKDALKGAMFVGDSE